MGVRASSATGTLLAVVFLGSGATSIASPRSVEYLSTSPGHYVEYLSLTVSGNSVMGFLESVHVSKAARDQVDRTMTPVSAKNNGDVILFGDRTATRTAEGYTLTYPTSTGEAGQQRFTRSTIEQINTSIRDLWRGTKQDRTLSETAKAKAELKTIAAAIVFEASRIAKYQSILDTAIAQQADFQRRADPLVTIARALRDKALAVIATAGADWSQNRSRIDAMKKADDAEEAARIAQREADSVSAAASAAKADLIEARIRMTNLGERNRLLSATANAGGGMAAAAPGGDVAGR